MIEIGPLMTAWLEAKKAETEAIQIRRKTEDALVSALGFSDQWEGTQTVKSDGYAMKITQRINRKIDADMLQEIAAETGLTDHLRFLFRWKPEINMDSWKSADPSITNPLSQAITAKPGRPSFTITQEQ